ncbi:hypothetical protein A2U01_0041910, partial [Trifolium medium]|nr:hypothetical protein [Trifolium medium]
LGRSPFEVVYGRQPPTVIRFLSNETKVAAVALELSERDEALKQLKLHLLRAQEHMKKYADSKRRDVKFEVQGDLPQELEIDAAEDIYPDKVLGTRVTVKAGVSVPQSLIQWKNKSLEDVTWEDDDFLKGQFPQFSLE